MISMSGKYTFTKYFTQIILLLRILHSLDIRQILTIPTNFFQCQQTFFIQFSFVSGTGCGKFRCLQYVPWLWSSRWLTAKLVSILLTTSNFFLTSLKRYHIVLAFEAKEVTFRKTFLSLAAFFRLVRLTILISSNLFLPTFYSNTSRV